MLSRVLFDAGYVCVHVLAHSLQMNGLWARVAYRGKSDGWVLTANKRGAMLTPEEDEAAAEALWSEQVPCTAVHNSCVPYFSN